VASEIQQHIALAPYPGPARYVDGDNEHKNITTKHTVLYCTGYQPPLLDFDFVGIIGLDS
jgi:hypothetical protein